MRNVMQRLWCAGGTAPSEVDTPAARIPVAAPPARNATVTGAAGLHRPTGRTGLIAGCFGSGIQPIEPPTTSGSIAAEFSAQVDAWAAGAPPQEAAGRQVARQKIKDAFTNGDRTLDLSGLHLTSLPPIVTHMTTIEALDLSGNDLVRLPPLPADLKTLDVNNNALTAISKLPQSIRSLHANHNQITAIAHLPHYLRTLDIADNQLSGLPALPGTLQELDMSNNNIRLLLTLPATLKRLKAENLPITQLPALPALTSLSLNGCRMPQLPRLPSSLTYLDLGQMALQHLPELPHVLASLHVSGNLLTTLPTLPGTLKILDVTQNQLATLPTLHAPLKRLGLARNRFTQLPALPSPLDLLDVRHNPLTTLRGIPEAIRKLRADPELVKSTIAEHEAILDALHAVVKTPLAGATHHDDAPVPDLTAGFVTPIAPVAAAKTPRGEHAQLALQDPAKQSGTAIDALGMDNLREIIGYLEPGSGDATRLIASAGMLNDQFQESAVADRRTREAMDGIRTTEMQLAFLRRSS